jgi:hypothetical protein
MISSGFEINSEKSKLFLFILQVVVYISCACLPMANLGNKISCTDKLIIYRFASFPSKIRTRRRSSETVWYCWSKEQVDTAQIDEVVGHTVPVEEHADGSEVLLESGAVGIGCCHCSCLGGLG